MIVENKYTVDKPISYKQFKKMFGIKEPKIPRKLKKAARHVMTIHHRPPHTSFENGVLRKTCYVIWDTIDGYPYTKWVRKAISRARNEYSKIIKRELQRMVDEVNQPIDMEEIKRRCEAYKIVI